MNLIEMKKANRCQVYQLVYQNRRISKTDIAEVLISVFLQSLNA